MPGPLIATVAGLATMLLASMTQGLTGFGFAIVSAPILIIFASPKIVVPLILMHSLMINGAILIEARKRVDLKRIWPLIVASMAGIPVGTYLLVVLDVGVLKIFIGSVIIPFVIAFWMGFNKPIASEKLAFAPVGFVSGLLCASTSVGGPPVILFFVNQGIEKRVFRANLVAYYMVSSVLTILSFIFSGVITREVMNYTLWLFPATVVGSITGIKLAHKVNEKLFRRAALIIIMIAAFTSIASGLGIWWVE